MYSIEKPDFKDFMDGAAASCGKKLTPVAITFYWDTLQEFALENIKLAVANWAKEGSRFFPTAPELYQAVKAITPVPEKKEVVMSDALVALNAEYQKALQLCANAQTGAERSIRYVEMRRLGEKLTNMEKSG